MFCWGKIAEGQPGLGETEDEPVLTPRNVDVSFGSLSEVKDIACGWEHTAVLKNDGVVYTCGNRENGQLGHHTEGNKLARVDSLETWTIKQVACGQMHTLAVTNKGLVFAWGDNTKGQLGLGSSDTTSHKHPRTSLNYLILNLAVADSTTAVFLPPRYIFSQFMAQLMAHPEGTASTALCIAFTGGIIGCVGAATGVFCSVAIAVKRYYELL